LYLLLLIVYEYPLFLKFSFQVSPDV
jgi:hypothetical protein